MTFFHVLSLFSLLIWTDAVNKDDFHTCSQSPFCLRQRSSDKLSEFACDPSTVRSSSSSSVTFSAIDKLSNSSVDVSVSAFKHGIYRLSVVDPSVIQFELPKVLSEECEGAGVPLRIVKRSNRQLELKCASCNDSVRVRCRPNLIVEVLDSDHEVLMSFNSKNRMYMEGDRRSIGGDVSFLGFDRVYGIPEHADSHALKSTTGKSDSEPYRLFNLDVFEYELDSQMALYGSIPVMYAHSINRPRTVGVFWMNAAEAWIDVDLGNANNRGKTSMVVNRAIHSISEWMRHLFRQKNQQQNESTKRESNISTHWMFDGGNIDLFFMTGSERPIDVIRQYMFLTGTAKLPPLSTLGYHQSRWSYMSQKEVMDLERNFDRLKIPLDHVWLDIDYTDGVKYFTWNAKFPSPQNLISLLQSHKRNLISIIDPHVKATSGYFVYDEGKSEGRFVKTHDGSDFEGHCWPGKSSWTDFFDPEAGKWYAGLYSRAGLVSTDYTWNDMNEPSVFGAGEITFPRDLVHFGNLTNREVHNLYGHLMTQYTQMGHYARNNDQRSFILTRSFFAGTQRSAAMWTGDNIATWEHMRASIPMILSMSISGIGFAGADVGGFFDNKGRDYELFTRWHQLAALLPFYRAHSHKESNRKEPWSFDDIEPKTSKIIGRQIERRYLLSPHIYTLFRLHETNGGDPVMRPLWMEFPSDENALDIEDAFLLGSSVLVFPALHPSKSAIDFYVPHGPNDDREAWMSMVDLSTFNGGQWYREPVPIDGYAYVLLKLGNIFPFKFRPRRSLLSTLGDPLTLFICPDWTGKAVGQVYVDNGVDMAYTRGHFVHRSFVFKNGVLKSTPYTKYKQPVLQNTTHGEWIERIVFCNHGPVVKTIKMTVIKSEKVSKTLQFEQTSGKYGNHLLVRKPGVRIEDDFVIEILH